MRPIERRISKIEDASGPPGDVRYMPDWQLHALICKSLTEECRAGRTLEEIVANYRENGPGEVAELIVECYVWDPELRVVRTNENIDDDKWSGKRSLRNPRGVRQKGTRDAIL
jgi:hypothetical protein